MRQKDLTGQKFGRLTVVKFIKDTPKNKWLCTCECGQKSKVTGYKLRSGHSKSCGCIRLEKFIKRTTKHGVAASSFKIYHAYKDMISRCYNNKLRNYKSYGGRGIKVCEEWRNNIQSFYKWCIENGFNDDLSLDRIDNDGDYEPSNCRWITQKKQCHNRSTNVYIEHNGIRETLIEAGKRYNISPQSIRYRLRKGWSIKDALEKPKTGNMPYSKSEKL